MYSAWGKRQLVRRLAAVLALGGAIAACAPAVASADIPGPAHSFPVVREGDAGLPGHTIIRPADPAATGFKLPIVVWGNGGCRNSNEEFHYFLTHFAAYGFFIVANGPPENPYHPEELEGILAPDPSKLVAAIDWAVKETARPDSKYFGRLDPARIAVMGQSCGGWEAVDASADPRVKATVAWNNGGDPHAGDVTKLHAPILYVSGGNSDYTIPITTQAYLRTTVPAVHADEANAGHTGFWDDPSDGSHSPMQDEPLVVAPQWFALTLYGQPAGSAFFFGADCGLCKRTDWTVESKNWEGVKFEPSEAPATAPEFVITPSPSPAPCSGRTVTVRPPRALRSAVISVDGVRRAVLRGARQIRRGARLRLTSASRARVTVRISGRTRSGRRVTRVRRYAVCA